MTQELKDKIKTIAEYDGWKVVPPGTYTQCHNQTIWFGHGGNYDCYHDVTSAEEMKYLTDLNWLHPVAMKVLGELNMKGSLTYWWNIRHHCAIRPINGEYIGLLNAVHDGIKFLNQHKTEL